MDQFEAGLEPALCPFATKALDINLLRCVLELERCCVVLRCGGLCREDCCSCEHRVYKKVVLNMGCSQFSSNECVLEGGLPSPLFTDSQLFLDILPKCFMMFLGNQAQKKS